MDIVAALIRQGVSPALLEGFLKEFQETLIKDETNTELPNCPPDHRDRDGLTRSLTELDRLSTIKALIELLQDPDLDVRHSASRILQSWEYSDGRNVLATTVGRLDSISARRGVEFLVNSHHPQ